MKLVIFVLALAVALSFAGEITPFGGTAGVSTWTGTDAETVYWTAPPTGSAQGSQYFPDNYPTYDAGIADDVEFAVATSVNKIRWWGGYWNGTGGPVDSPVEIYLYMDDGTGNAPTLPQHTSAIQSWMINPGEYTEVADGANFMCEFVFDPWVDFAPGQKYWFEVRKAMNLTPFGQYGWIGSDPIQLSPCVQGFDGLGVVWWTAQATDAAFELVFDDALALERSTWAGIKANF